MRTLYHQTLDPSCRSIRIILGEKRLDYNLRNVTYDQEFPVFIDENNANITNSLVITEYLNEVYSTPDLIGHNAVVRVDARRIAMYFSDNIQSSVTLPLLQAKCFKARQGSNSAVSSIANAHAGLAAFMEYIAFLDSNNNWLAGPSFSIADIFAAAQISTLDYLGVIDWQQHIAVQRWYRRIKSRRSIEGVLADQIDDLTPPSHYSDPDF